MGARWYDDQLGRWISADTIVPGSANPQSFNRFAYVYNNPLKYVDPSGHDPLDLDSLLLHIRVIFLAREYADGDINVSIDLVRTAGEDGKETTELEITISSPDGAFPSFTTDEAVMAARIVGEEVGTGEYIRGGDWQVEEASYWVAWTMRNWAEIGDQEYKEGPYGGYEYIRDDGSRCNDRNPCVFSHYDPYDDDEQGIKPLPQAVDPFVLRGTVHAFVDPGADPTGGAIYNFGSGGIYDPDNPSATGRRRHDVEYSWVPKAGGDEQTIYFWRNWPYE